MESNAASPHYNLGLVLLDHQCKFREGVEHLERAGALAPSLAAAWFNLLRAYLAANQPAAALKAAAQYLELEPDATDAPDVAEVKKLLPK